MIERCTGSVGLSATRGREAGLFGLELRQPSRATLHAGAEEYAAPDQDQRENGRLRHYDPFSEPHVAHRILNSRIIAVRLGNCSYIQL